MLILVGAGGFLGRHMCELLERKGERAIAVVRRGDRSFSDRFAASFDVIDDATFASSAGLDLLAEAHAVTYSPGATPIESTISTVWEATRAAVR